MEFQIRNKHENSPAQLYLSRVENARTVARLEVCSLNENENRGIIYLTPGELGDLTCAIQAIAKRNRMEPTCRTCRHRPDTS